MMGSVYEQSTIRRPSRAPLNTIKPQPHTAHALESLPLAPDLAVVKIIPSRPFGYDQV